MAEAKEPKFLKEHNESIQQLAQDITKAIDTYLHKDDYNFATLIGVLEDVKTNISIMAKDLSPKDRVIMQSKPPGYIG